MSKLTRVSRVALFGVVLLFALSRPNSARACGWDWETFAAEASRLPCVNDLILGAFGTHTPEYYEATVRATDYALAWAPHYTEALDAKGMALVHLGRLAEAEPVLLTRLRAAPDAYPSHANLGTLLTFSGHYDRALVHVDRALEIEPKAHFGREKYHRALVVFLRDKPAAPAANFLGLTLDDEQRYHGSLPAFEKARVEADVFDALASMIAVYGAEGFADLYLALGDVLALRGEVKMAWAAYRRATELGHPAKTELTGYMSRLLAQVRARAKQRRPRDDGEYGLGQHGGYYGLDVYYASARLQASRRREDYHAWERAQLKRGLRPWVTADIERTYARMDRLRERCKTPGLIRGELPGPKGKP
jgi:tetratricopeptide (TPR) repeat protein